MTVLGTLTSLIVIFAPSRTTRVTEPPVTRLTVAPRRYWISAVSTTVPIVTGWIRSYLPSPQRSSASESWSRAASDGVPSTTDTSVTPRRERVPTST